jgi:hypothetical protein
MVAAISWPTDDESIEKGAQVISQRAKKARKAKKAQVCLRHGIARRFILVPAGSSRRRFLAVVSEKAQWEEE